MKMINSENRVKFRDLSKEAQIKRIIVLTLECITALCGLIALIVWMTKGDPNKRMINCINTAVLVFLPWIFELIIGRRFTFGQHLVFIFFMFFGSFVGSCLYLFESVSFYDELIHGMAGYLLCIPLMGILLTWLKSFDKSNTLISSLVILLVSLGTGTLWEVVEFVMDLLFAQNGLGYFEANMLSPELVELYNSMPDGIGKSWFKVQYVFVFDTITDMSLHTIGTLVFIIHYVAHRLSHKNLLMGYMITDAKSDEMNKNVRLDDNYRGGNDTDNSEEPTTETVAG